MSDFSEWTKQIELISGCTSDERCQSFGKKEHGFRPDKHENANMELQPENKRIERANLEWFSPLFLNEIRQQTKKIWSSTKKKKISRNQKNLQDFLTVYQTAPIQWVNFGGDKQEIMKFFRVGNEMENPVHQTKGQYRRKMWKWWNKNSWLLKKTSEPWHSIKWLFFTRRLLTNSLSCHHLSVVFLSRTT